MPPEITITAFDTDPSTPRAVARLLRCARPADPISNATLAQKVLLDPNVEQEGALFARTEAGQIVGFVLAIARRYPLFDAPPDFDRGYITLLAVAEEHRRRGIGTALLKAAEDYLRGRGCTSIWVSPYAPNYFTPGVDVNAYPEALAFFAHHRFTEVYRPLAMDAFLPGVQTPEWVRQRRERMDGEGYRFGAFEWPDDILPLRAFLRAEFPGDWQRYVGNTMGDIAAGRRPPSNLWVARNTSGVVGFAQHEGERFGPFGVAASERGKGIGQVLLYQTLQAMREQGLHDAWFLWTDDKTADRIYKPAGFRETRRFAVLRKEL